MFVLITSIVFMVSHNIDFATLTGQGSLGKVVKTTFLFKGTTVIPNTRYECVSNIGTSVGFLIYNSCCGMFVFKGSEKMIRVHHQLAFRMSSGQNSEIGIQGIALTGSHYSRFSGIRNGSQTNPVEWTYGVDGPSGDFPQCGYGTALPDVGTKMGLVVNYDCIRETIPGLSGERWILDGSYDAIGVKSFAKFSIICEGVTGFVPMLYQRGSANTVTWYHLIDVYEAID